MTRKFFGTDGIRGRTNASAINATTALKIGQAAGQLALRGDHRHRVVIGKDTRLSGYMLEGALEAGFTSVGVDVTLVGPMPTPAVAMLTTSMRADIGVMISASHNPYEDNGIKLFGPDGYKLSDEDEAELERLLEVEPVLAASDKIGRVKRIDDVKGRYIHFAKATFPDRLRLDGLKIVIDCANGAGYNVAPAVLWELGADIVPIGVDPDGTNINKQCGSTYPQTMQEAVVASGAHIGLALDGDADRLIVCDERGAMIDGDQIMALIAKRLQAEGQLTGGAVVATVMSNMGLERCLRETGLGLMRTKVGDRHVLAEMRASGCNVGGEQSGHIILTDHATTGDGLLAGLQVLAALVESGEPASRLLRQFDPVPQLLKNVRYRSGNPLEDEAVKRVIAAAENDFGSGGRLVIRKSGTEPLVRVMAEGDNSDQVSRWVDEICAAVENVAA